MKLIKKYCKKNNKEKGKTKMQKLAYLVAVCLLLGALFGLGKAGLSAYNDYTNLTKKALEQNVKTETFHIYNVTETKEDQEKNLDTTEGIRIVVRKSDDLLLAIKVNLCNLT